MLLNDVDADMLDATNDYFTKLTSNLDRKIKTAEMRTRLGNARKPARVVYWNELLAIWCKLGGKATGIEAASFLVAASEPVGASASIEAVAKWLDRRIVWLRT